MSRKVYPSIRYKGFVLFTTEEDPSVGQTWCCEISECDYVIHTEFSILSAEQAAEKAKAYVDKFVDYGE